MKRIGIILVLIIIILGSVYYVKTAKNVIELNDESPVVSKNVTSSTTSDVSSSATQVLASGDLMRKIHTVKGKVLVIQAQNKKVLRFEDFETDNGPDLHIYLSKDLDAKEYIDLGPIKATKGNANYDLPPEVDLKKYNKVLVWCVPFKVLFSYAELN